LADLTRVVKRKNKKKIWGKRKTKEGSRLEKTARQVRKIKVKKNRRGRGRGKKIVGWLTNGAQGRLTRRKSVFAFRQSGEDRSLTEGGFRPR